MKKSLFIFSILFLVAFVFNISEAQTYSNCYTFRYYLVRGSTDANTQGEVSRLQNILYNMRLLETKPTGYFGVLTENALRTYQYNKKIQPTGTAGPVTRTSLSNCTNIGIQPGTNTSTGGNLPIDFFSFNKKTTLSVPYGSILILPNLSQDSKYPGYIFRGWYINQDYTINYASSTIISPQAFYARWVKTCNQNTIAIYPNNCVSTASSTTSTTTNNNLEAPIYEPMSTDTKECPFESYTITVPIEMECP